MNENKITDTEIREFEKNAIAAKNRLTLHYLREMRETSRKQLKIAVGELVILAVSIGAMLIILAAGILTK
jgi:hypothetical protein